MIELSVDNNNLAVNSFLKEVPIIENQFLYDTEYDRGLRHERVNYFCKKYVTDVWEDPKDTREMRPQLQRN